MSEELTPREIRVQDVEDVIRVLVSSRNESTQGMTRYRKMPNYRNEFSYYLEGRRDALDHAIRVIQICCGVKE